VGKIMSKVPNPEESQMPQAHSELSRQETLAKTMFISGA
jgi:hypothetical protein